MSAIDDFAKYVGIPAKDIAGMDFESFCGWVFLADADVTMFDPATGKTIYIADGYRVLWEAP